MAAYGGIAGRDPTGAAGERGPEEVIIARRRDPHGP
jgi:hypothetical protein